MTPPTTLSHSMRSRRPSLVLAALLLALAPLAGAQPDQRQFSSDTGVIEPLPTGPAEAAPVVAEAAAATVIPATLGDGQQARGWLDLQASGTAAAGAPRPMPGEVADAVYLRYLNSFRHPIPEQFRRQNGNSGGSGGQGGQGGSGESSN